MFLRSRGVSFPIRELVFGNGKTPLPRVSVAGPVGTNSLAYKDVADVRDIHVVVLDLGLVYRGKNCSVATRDSLVVRYFANVRLGKTKGKHLVGISHFVIN